MQPEPIELGSGTPEDWLAQFPLSTKGRHIVNKFGERFRLRGINWYGASDTYHIVGGLDVQRLEVICDAIHSLGFNVVRLPFSNEMLTSQPAQGSIDFGKNPQLEGLSALQVLDEVVRCLGRHGVAVVLNNHTTYGEWCGGPDRNGLWFDPGSKVYTTEKWIDDWVMLGRRYKMFAHVVGHDLRNEVRFCPWPFRWPSWNSSSCSRIVGGCDWAQASTACASQLLEICPEKLIVIERIIWPMRSLHSYASTLGFSVPTLPHRFQGKLVLGVHHYSWNGPGRYLAFAHTYKTGCLHLIKRVLRFLGIFSNANYGEMKMETLYEHVMDQWGHLLSTDCCPVWISEFGTGNNEGFDLDWFRQFVRILGDLDADYAYWPLNVGPKPGSGEDESYGVLSETWTPKPHVDVRLKLLEEHGLLPKQGMKRKIVGQDGQQTLRSFDRHTPEAVGREFLKAQLAGLSETAWKAHKEIQIALKSDIGFEASSDELTSVGRRIVKKVASVLNRHSSLQVCIECHTGCKCHDSDLKTGPLSPARRKNDGGESGCKAMDLSQRRAKAVVDALKSAGCKNVFTSTGHGCRYRVGMAVKIIPAKGQ
eukprot:TRINITY_DN27372_c0_g1_i2.p1 TRINITY_DN27372_c0_g1~~TRINITY_DN27372_c0_g1_i2.p1  ORF type:complete len:608 (-),score=66.79 TRINITY_DN27372_c0_g1_i2:126-1898(-)